jgi:hypothetical protein
LGGAATLKWANTRASKANAAKEKPIPFDTRWIGKSDDQLAKGAKWLKPAVNKYDVIVHGEPNGFWVYEKVPGPGGFYVAGEGDKWTQVSHRQLARYMESSGWKGQPVRLVACNTGNSDGGKPVAQDLANKLGVRVTAPTEKVWIYPDGKTVISNNDPPKDDSPHVSTGKWVDFYPGGNKPDKGE